MDEKKILFIPTINERKKIAETVSNIRSEFLKLNQVEQFVIIQTLMQDYTNSTGIKFMYGQKEQEEDGR